MAVRVWIAGLLLAVTAAAQAIVVSDVTVVPMDRARSATARTLAHQDVVVFDGRVRAMGAHGAVPVPEGSSVVDGTGRYLLPGLCDMHVHLSDRAELLLYVAHGVTTVRNMWGGGDTLALRERIARGAVFGPTIYTTGPIVDGPDPRWPGSAVVTDMASARQLVDDEVAAGYDAVKVYDGLGVDAYLAIAQRCKQRGIPFVGHVPWAVGLRGAIASGQRSIEHLTGWREVEDDAIDALAARCAAAGVWNCPTLVVLDLPWVALRDLDAARARPEVQLVPPSIRARWDPKTDARFGGVTEVDDELWHAHLARMDRSRRIVKALFDAGAPMVVGTDAPNPFVVPGFAVHQELEELCAAGLSPYAVLRMATVEAARFLGREDAGMVAVGQVADLLLLAKDPLADVTATRAIAGVCLHGRWLPRAELDARLAELVAGYAVPEDWYAKLAPMAGTGLLSFEVTWNGQPIGAERVRRTALEGGGEQWEGQWVYREGFAEERCSFVRTVGTDGQVMVIDAADGDRTGRVRAELGKGEVRATGHTPFGQDVDAREPAAAGEQLGPGILPDACAFAPTLADLAVGQKTEVVLRTVEIAETFELPVTRVTVERAEDGSRALRGGRVPVRIYRIRSVTGAWTTRGTLTLSADDGAPATIELVYPQGQKLFRRVD